jgi:hypothetical protein
VTPELPAQLAVFHVPDSHETVLAAGRHETAIARNGDRLHITPVALESADYSLSPQIPQYERVFAAQGGDKTRAVRRQGAFAVEMIVVDCPQKPAILGVPDFYLVID